MEFAVTYSIPDVYFADKLWISAVHGPTALSRPGTFLGDILSLIRGLIALQLSLRGVSFWEDLIEIYTRVGQADPGEDISLP